MHQEPTRTHADRKFDYFLVADRVRRVRVPVAGALTGVGVVVLAFLALAVPFFVAGVGAVLGILDVLAEVFATALRVRVADEAGGCSSSSDSTSAVVSLISRGGARLRAPPRVATLPPRPRPRRTGKRDSFFVVAGGVDSEASVSGVAVAAFPVRARFRVFGIGSSGSSVAVESSFDVRSCSWTSSFTGEAWAFRLGAFVGVVGAATVSSSPDSGVCVRFEPLTFLAPFPRVDEVGERTGIETSTINCEDGGLIDFCGVVKTALSGDAAVGAVTSAAGVRLRVDRLGRVSSGVRRDVEVARVTRASGIPLGSSRVDVDASGWRDRLRVREGATAGTGAAE